jgi:DNA-binding transcriptional MerR regulator
MASITLTMRELSDQSGVTARTLRQWVHEGVLPPPRGRGRAARYETQHALRARAAQALRKAGGSLSAVRRKLASMSDEDLAAFAPKPVRVTDAHGVPAPPPAPSYPSDPWEVVQLMDGIVMMVNPRRGPALRRIADEIYRHYAMPMGDGRNRGGLSR